MQKEAIKNSEAPM